MNSKRLLSVLLTVSAATALLVASATAQEGGKKKTGDWTMWGGSPDRNMVSDETGIPAEWDVKSGKNIAWTAKLGSQTYGNAVISNGKVFVGTNNGALRRPSITGDKGLILCFDEKTGKMLWQLTHDKLPTGRVNDWPEQGICSSPYVVGDRMYYVSNRCEVVCADVNGFLDGKNDGPFTGEKYKDKQDGDIVWALDMMEDWGVFPHNLATSSPVGSGNLIFVITSNGVDEGHLDIPDTGAPSFMAIHKDTGKVIWEGYEPAGKILHGQWSSPAYGVMGGKPQVVFPGGDGWCYSYEPKTGKLLWKFDLNPKGSTWELGGRGTRNNIIATPVIYDNKVFLCVGQDPEHGEGVGHLYAIDATKRGDITDSGKVWHYGGTDFNRSMSTVAIKDGLLYATDLSGFLYCLDVKTGKRHWRYDTLSAIWGSPYVVDGKVMIGTEDGEVHVLEHSKKMKKLAVNDMNGSVYTTPVASNGVLYIVNQRTLYAIAGK